MSTPCESVYDVFFDLIEEDRDFFNYYEATDEESYMLALQRAKALLRDAAIRMQMECDAEIDFTDTYTESEGRKQKEFFTADLTPFEIDLLANLMYEGYLKRDVSKLRAFQHQYTPSDLQVFSPANDRKTFMAMYNTVVEENKVKLDRYARRDRTTGKQRSIDYTSYETEES